MTYLDELRSFVATDEVPGGLVEYDCELYPGTERELTIQCYAQEVGVLERDVVPVVERVLGQLDELMTGLRGLDADLAQIILWNGLLGLHFWSRAENNEFTAIFAPEGSGWHFTGYGDIFAD